jgi:hypothetical protein
LLQVNGCTCKSIKTKSNIGLKADFFLFGYRGWAFLRRTGKVAESETEGEAPASLLEKICVNAG